MGEVVWGWGRENILTEEHAASLTSCKTSAARAREGGTRSPDEIKKGLNVLSLV